MFRLNALIRKYSSPIYILPPRENWANDGKCGMMTLGFTVLPHSLSA